MNVYIWTSGVLKNDFIGEYTGRLPSWYQEVEYIQSSWTQYIDTWYTPTTSTRFAWKYNITSKPTEYWVLMAVRSNSAYPPQNTLYIWWRNLSERQWLIYIMPSTYDYGNNSYWWTIWVDYEISYNGSVLKNGTSSINISFTSAPTKSIYLFANNDINGYTWNENWCAKLYYMKFYNSDTLVRDFVPCYRKSDSAIGLYDLVNNKFYANYWSWSFTKWADVN